MSDIISQIEFTLTGRVTGMHFQPLRPEGIEFNVTDPSPLRSTLRPYNQEGVNDSAWRDLECKVYAAMQVTEYQLAFATSYISSQTMLNVAEDITLPFEKNGKVLITTEGTYEPSFHPRRKHCPVEIRELLDKAEIELTQQMDRFLKLIRWRQGIDAPGEIVHNRSLYWRTKDGPYSCAPLSNHSPTEFEIPAMFGIHWEEDNVSDLRELWANANLTEPLGHALVREAGALAKDSPRSAILIMTSALETAVKMHISRIASDTAWLMEEIPSPPIFKILRDYIPDIHKRRGTVLDYWPKLHPWFKKVQKLIEARNKVAHTGTIPDDVPPIWDSLQTVTDLLYILDVLDGHEWAKERVGYPLRLELGWPAPKHGRITLKVRMEY
jgi:hypothetical protein